MDQLQKHLDHALSGNKKINPDEQNHFLGTFRERIFLIMTLAEMKSTENFQNLEREIQKDQQYPLMLKINCNLSSELQGKYMKLANSKNIEFTIINQHVGDSPDDLGLVLHGKEAVNREFIDLDHLYPQENLEKTINNDTAPKKKKSFWQRLFH